MKKITLIALGIICCGLLYSFGRQETVDYNNVTRFQIDEEQWFYILNFNEAQIIYQKNGRFVERVLVDELLGDELVLYTENGRFESDLQSYKVFLQDQQPFIGKDRILVLGQITRSEFDGKLELQVQTKTGEKRYQLQNAPEMTSEFVLILGKLNLDVNTPGAKKQSVLEVIEVVEL
jgi:hypothetical protein